MADLNVRILLSLVDRVSNPAKKIKQNLKGIGKAGKKASKDFDIAGNLNQAAEGVTRLAQAAERLLVAPVVEFAEFEKSIVEVSTLIDESKISQQKLTEITEAAALQFGGKAQEQAKALYQIISAGAGDAATATELLDAANKLAIGGVTDVETAVDGLTSVLNAFGSEVIGGPTAAADIFFSAVKDGKTNVEQLASSIGRVAPIANAAGLTFEETAAAIATLTKQGISTKESVSGLKQAFANVLKPTREARKEAKRLKIEFGATALRAKGLSGFLESVTKTSGLSRRQLRKLQKQSGGSAEEFERLVIASGANVKSLTKLFGSIEGVNAVLALSAGGGEEFNKILRNSEGSADLAGEAYEKMNKTQSQALERGEAQMDAFTRTIGEGFTPAINDALREVAGWAAAMGRFAKDNPDTVRTVGSLLIKLIAVGGALRAVLLVTSTLSSVKGLFGLAKAAGAATEKSDGLATSLGKTSKAGSGVGKMLVGNLGLIAAVGGISFAFATWADEAFGISNALAGISDEGARLNRLGGRGSGVALLGDIDPADRAALKDAQDELAALQAKREELTGTFGGPTDKDLERFTDIPDRMRAAQAKITAIEKRGRARGDLRAREAAEDAAIPFVGPAAPVATPQETAGQLKELVSRVGVDIAVKDDRTVATVRSVEGNVEASVDSGIAGTGA